VGVGDAEGGEEEEEEGKLKELTVFDKVPPPPPPPNTGEADDEKIPPKLTPLVEVVDFWRAMVTPGAKVSELGFEFETSSLLVVEDWRDKGILRESLRLNEDKLKAGEDELEVKYFDGSCCCLVSPLKTACICGVTVSPRPKGLSSSSSLFSFLELVFVFSVSFTCPLSDAEWTLLRLEDLDGS
jgi:hypothetical protein